jgi:hypothetical protein
MQILEAMSNAKILVVSHDGQIKQTQIDSNHKQTYLAYVTAHPEFINSLPNVLFQKHHIYIAEIQQFFEKKAQSSAVLRR